MKHFYMKQKVFSIRDRYKVFDEEQNVIFHCEGKLFSLTHQMKLFETATDTLVFTFKKKLFHLMATYQLYDLNGDEIALVKRRFAFFRPKVDIESKFGDFNVEGDYFGHNFSILEDNNEIASISKKWISWGDSYEIAILDESRYQLLLGIIILIDRIFHENKNRSHR